VKSSVSFIIREMQIKATLRCHLIHVGRIKETKMNVVKDMDRRETLPSYWLRQIRIDYEKQCEASSKN
jgi:hypothetical protein